MVVGGIPGILSGAIPGLKWKEVEAILGDKTIKLLVSAKKFKYFSNNFRGVLVKADAVPLLQERPGPLRLEEMAAREPRRDL